MMTTLPTLPTVSPSVYTVDDFDYDLPPELIAQHPATERSASRLLDARAGNTAPGPRFVDRVFRDLPQLLDPGDLLVLNDTKVIKARLFGRKASGGQVEALVERVLPSADASPSREIWAHVRASKSPKVGQTVRFADAFDAEVLGRCGPDNGLFWLRLDGDAFALLELHGHVPLPPYITHGDDADDERRYQSLFARHPGAVAAPTASLHFDEGVLAAMTARGVQRASVTLHVGAGTFQPVRVTHLSDHHMHSEWFDVPDDTVAAIERTHAAGHRVVAVGTTSLRALESAARSGRLCSGAAETDIFITPGYRFQVVDRLVTNFHLPRSTLLMLVSALAGHDTMRAAYAHAVEQRYRFFSYGDAMVVDRAV